MLLDGKIITLEEEEEIFIPKGSIHSMCNLSMQYCSLHETQVGECYEDDIIRYWDINGRDVLDYRENEIINFIQICESLIPKLTEIKTEL